MADIMLVLLIIFMVVTPMLTKGLSVELAKVSNPTDMPNADKDDAVIVGISASGDVYLGSTKSDISQIADQVRDRISEQTGQDRVRQERRPRQVRRRGQSRG